MRAEKRFYTPDEYRRLALNPFVDGNMLRFVKKRTLGAPSPNAGSAVPGNKKPLRSTNEATIRLITDAIKTMLRE